MLFDQSVKVNALIETMDLLILILAIVVWSESEAGVACFWLKSEPKYFLLF